MKRISDPACSCKSQKLKLPKTCERKITGGGYTREKKFEKLKMMRQHPGDEKEQPKNNRLMC